MRISSGQVGQLATYAIGFAVGVAFATPGYLWPSLIVGAVGLLIIWADVRWLSWPDDREGPRFPDGS
jgi:hypothetical protein